MSERAGTNRHRFYSLLQLPWPDSVAMVIFTTIVASSEIYLSFIWRDISTLIGSALGSADSVENSVEYMIYWQLMWLLIIVLAEIKHRYMPASTDWECALCRHEIADGPPRADVKGVVACPECGANLRARHALVRGRHMSRKSVALMWGYVGVVWAVSTVVTGGVLFW